MSTDESRNGGFPSRLPDAAWRQRPGLAELCAALGSHLGEARFVGGAVRDTLLALPVKDVDIATLHAPQIVIERVTAAGFKAAPTGIDHGTITAVVHKWPIEITTLRRDVSTDGRRAKVAFATDWREDAARRDFTMNALYADPESGKIDDWFGGLDDLAQGRVRFIGDPAARIAEDRLRVLRFFRFAARFGTLDTASGDYRACLDAADSLMALSRERIADELLRLLGVGDPAFVVRAMVRDDVLAAIIPEIDMAGVDQLTDLIAAERALTMPADPLRRLSALLPQAPDVAKNVATRLRLSKKAIKRVVTAATPVAALSPRALAYRIGAPSALDQILLRRAFTLEDAQLLGDDWEPPRLPVSGGDLIDMGLEAGPQVAHILRELEGLWLEAGFPSRAATRAMATQLVSQALRERQNS